MEPDTSRLLWVLQLQQKGRQVPHPRIKTSGHFISNPAPYTKKLKPLLHLIKKLHLGTHLTSSQLLDFERKFSQVELDIIIWLPLKSGHADSINCVASIDAIWRFGRIKEEHWMNPVDFLIASVGQESTFAIIRILTEAETMKVRTVEIILTK